MKKIVPATTFTLTLLLACLSVAAQTQSRDDVLKQIEAKRAELAALEKKFIDPTDADREGYATFLAQADTGIIRLLPREKYDGHGSSNKKHALNMYGGGAYYSFFHATHEYGRGSDIELQQGDLMVGFAGADYGLLLNLGEVPIEQLTTDHLAVRALLGYTPKTKEEDARKEARALSEGIDVSGFVFKYRARATVSNTYLLRSISFDTSDIAVAFRVVREDTDGSIILVFKVLKKYPTPKLERTQTAINN